MRLTFIVSQQPSRATFPFLFGGTFIEAGITIGNVYGLDAFPFLFGGTFIEAEPEQQPKPLSPVISLPFRRDFH